MCCFIGNVDDIDADVTAVQLTSALTARMTSEGSKDPQHASGNYSPRCFIRVNLPHTSATRFSAGLTHKRTKRALRAPSSKEVKSKTGRKLIK